MAWPRSAGQLGLQRCQSMREHEECRAHHLHRVVLACTCIRVGPVCTAPLMVARPASRLDGHPAPVQVTLQVTLKVTLQVTLHVCVCIRSRAVPVVPPGLDGHSTRPTSDTPNNRASGEFERPQRAPNTLSDAPSDAPSSTTVKTNCRAQPTRICLLPRGYSAACQNRANAAQPCNNRARRVTTSELQTY